MACDKILHDICFELAENIDSELCSRLVTHLQECPHCSGQLSAMRNTVHLYHALAEPEVPPEIHARLTQLLNLSDCQPGEKR